MAKGKKDEPAPGDPKEGTGFTVETFQRQDGMWSFRINGQESAYYSTSPEGLQRTINAVLNGPKEGGIKLTAVKGKAVKAQEAPGNEWMTEKTVEGRVAKFMTRGKLGKKDKTDD